jgi:hypothetical protein
MRMERFMARYLHGGAEENNGTLSTAVGVPDLPVTARTNSLGSCTETHRAVRPGRSATTAPEYRLARQWNAVSFKRPEQKIERLSFEQPHSLLP